MENGTNHSLFKGSNQLTSVGYMKLFGCYEIGEKRLNMIFKQEILGLEPISTKNRHTRNVEVTKVKNLKDKSKVSNAQDSYVPHTIPQDGNSTLSTQEQEPSKAIEFLSIRYISNFTNEMTSPEKTRAPSIEEKSILETLSSYDTTPPDDAVHRVLDSLLVYWNGWTKKKVRDAPAYGLSYMG